ncbi:hypothetical protein QBC37DRAFT_22148 [Rhypophila decipiens]|uniref:Uncharacterized protein n=1 Tax=Rhypophila decipiens TaxID=261697 RepID=A0AAN6Y2F1_9PEZI|nr:hypothetical protein QBC37DRAFT_22148 [Rhypophila decipiens]
MPKISEVVKRDLRLLQDAYHHLWTVGPEDRKPNEFIWPLKRYLVVEDLLVTPALEEHLGKLGATRHKRLSDDDESMNEKLKHMQTFDVTEPSHEAALKAIWVDLEPHMREEAGKDLDQLEESLSQSESEALGSRYERISQLLQQPYGEHGAPDKDILMALLDTPRKELITKFGLTS